MNIVAKVINESITRLKTFPEIRPEDFNKICEGYEVLYRFCMTV